MTRDKEMQRRERSLVMGSWQEAHYTTLKTGLCKAYLAACVVGSDLVSTSKTGTMGTVSGYTPSRLEASDSDIELYILYFSRPPQLRTSNSKIGEQLTNDLPVQVGKVLKLIAGVAPVLGGLTNMATTALEAGDRYLQTQRVVKVSRRQHIVC